MSGDIQFKMAEGIDNTQCICVFVTERYLSKVSSADVRDNCCFEFGYALRRHGSMKFIPVVVEQRMQNTNSWRGKGGAALGGLLYTDLVNHSNQDDFDRGCADLLKKIEAMVGKEEISRVIFFYHCSRVAIMD